MSKDTADERDECRVAHAIEADHPQHHTGIWFPLIGGVLMALIAIAVVLFGPIDHPTGLAEANATSIEETIQIPDCYQPLPSGEGSLVLDVKPPVGILEQFSDVRRYILFFSSTTEPRVEIRYDLKERHFQVGLPTMGSQQVDIFDQRMHQIAYTYKEGANQQLFIDGKKVNESAFATVGSASITGFAVSDRPSVYEYDTIEGLDANVKTYGHVIEADQFAFIEKD